AISAASLAGSQSSASPISTIQPVTLSSAETVSRGHKCRSTFRLWERASASTASSAAPITPVEPRSVSGGTSLNRYFVTGQLNPQPTEVMARNIRPAGAIRAGAVGFDSVMEPGKGRKSDGISAHHGPYPPLRPRMRGHARPPLPVALTRRAPCAYVSLGRAIPGGEKIPAL